MKSSGNIYNVAYIMKDIYIKRKLLRSDLLGLTTCVTFDFTNHSIFHNWNLEIIMMDTL